MTGCMYFATMACWQLPVLHWMVVIFYRHTSSYDTSDTSSSDTSSYDASSYDTSSSSSRTSW